MSHMSAAVMRGAHVEELIDDSDPDSVLEAEEESESLDHAHELTRDIDLAFDEAHQQRDQDAMMAAFLRSLAQAQAADRDAAAQGRPSQHLAPYTILAPPQGDEEDEDDEAPPPPQDDSFLGWLRSSLPSSGSLTAPRLQHLALLNTLRVGRWTWNLTTASALLLLPFFFASQAEDVKVQEANLLMQLEARNNLLEQGGGGGGDGIRHGADGRNGSGRRRTAGTHP